MPIKGKKMKKKYLIILLLFGLALPAIAQDDGSAEDIIETDDFDSLFEDEEMIEEKEERETSSAPEEDLLTEEQGVRLGGSFSSSLEALFVWNDYTDFALDHSDRDRLSPLVEGTLFFDGRPDPDFRVFGKLTASYPFTEQNELTFLDGAVLLAGPTLVTSEDTAVVAVPSIRIDELFADFNADRRVFFRTGKFSVNWGVGYFFSPADVISLAPIDPEDPEAEREGPFSVRVHLPVDIHNIYFYTVASESIFDDGEVHIDELAVAPKLEFLLGSYEFSIAAHYQQDLAPKAMLTAIGPLGDLDLFAEGVFSYGSDRTMVREQSGSPGSYETYKENDLLHFSGTAGLRYIKDFEDNAGTFSAAAQYLFQSDGYQDAELVEEAAALYALQEAGAVGNDPVLAPRDLFRPGRHYVAASLSYSDIFQSDIGISLLYQMNISDGSGIFLPTLSFAPIDHMKLSLSSGLAYGNDNREFTSSGKFSLSATVRLGTGNF
jgi:hypothetical protein